MNSDEEVLVENGRKFQKVSTLPVAVIQIILCVCQIILVFMLPELCDKKGRECIINSFSLLIYTHGFHWCCILIMDQVLHFSHHKSRLNGYLDFYIRTKNIRRAPFYLVSAGNAVLMLVVIILHDLCDNNEACKHTNTKVDYLRGLITLESLIVICLVVNYIIVLRDFNTQQLPPDVLSECVLCICMGNKCTRCGVQGHASKLHLATDLKFRLAIMNTHGPESFAHFWADEERKEDNLAHRVIQPVEQAAPAEPIEKGRGGSGTGGYWSNQAGRRGRGAYAGKGGRHQESKPYYRQHIDPWTAPGNSRGSKKSKR